MAQDGALEAVKWCMRHGWADVFLEANGIVQQWYPIMEFVAENGFDWEMYRAGSS
jgi:hypothetical protein